MINWQTSKQDMKLITRIAQRAVVMAEDRDIFYPFQDCDMDITACHMNGNALDLKKLIDFDDFNFSHDVFGIRRYIDRETGELKDCFSPRCAKPTK